MDTDLTPTATETSPRNPDDLTIESATSIACALSDACSRSAVCPGGTGYHLTAARDEVAQWLAETVQRARKKAASADKED